MNRVLVTEASVEGLDEAFRVCLPGVPPHSLSAGETNLSVLGGEVVGTAKGPKTRKVDELHPPAQRDLPEVQHLWFYNRVFIVWWCNEW